MFKEWGFLLTEIWLLLLMAALLGLFVGWWIWGRSSQNNTHAEDLEKCRRKVRDLEGQLERQQSKPAEKAKQPSPAASAKVAKPAKTAKPTAPAKAAKPAALSAARNGKADDLKLIKGVGPKLEKLCQSLGFYHYDQIANWTSGEVTWVDENLEGFKGRVTRDEWVSQAKILAEGGETEFSRKNS